MKYHIMIVCLWAAVAGAQQASISASSQKHINRMQLFKAIKDKDHPKVHNLLKAGTSFAPLTTWSDPALVQAVRYGAFDIAVSLIEFGADVNESNLQGTSPLMYAVRLKNTDFVRLLLSKGAQVNHSNRSDETALMLAVSKGALEIAKTLIQAGASLEHRDAAGRNLLMRALWDDTPATRLAMLRLLLQHKVDVNGLSDSNSSPLMVAAQNQLSEEVELLLAAGADPNVANTYGYTALSQAVSRDDKRSVQNIIRAGANVNARDVVGRTAFMNAVHQGHMSVIDTLLNSNIDLDVQDKKGHTAFSLVTYMDSIELVDKLLPYAGLPLPEVPYARPHDAARQTQLILGAAAGQSFEAMRFLLDNGVHPDMANLSGVTALMLVVYRKNAKLMDLLLRYGANPNAQTQLGQGALHIAVDLAYLHGIEALLQAGVDINKADKMQGYTPLIMAARQSAPQTMQVLLKAGAKVNIRDRWHKTALVYAVEHNNALMVKMLLQYGADPNLKTREWGHTPLMIAAWKGYNEKILQRLLIAGAQVNERSLFDGTTALMLAAKRGNKAFVRLLLLAGANPNTTNTKRQNALMLFSQHAYNMSLISVFKRAGINLQLRDIYNKRAVDYLQENKYFQSKSAADKNTLLRQLMQ